MIDRQKLRSLAAAAGGRGGARFNYLQAVSPDVVIEMLDEIERLEEVIQGLAEVCTEADNDRNSALPASDEARLDAKRQLDAAFAKIE